MHTCKFGSPTYLPRIYHMLYTGDRSPALQVDSLPAEPPGKPIEDTAITLKKKKLKEQIDIILIIGKKLS